MQTARHTTSPRARMFYAIAGVVLLIVGILGLLIPIIPGVLFIAAAIYVFGKVSRRVRAWSHRSPHWRAMHYRFERLGAIRPAAHIRVLVLMGVGACIASVGVVASAVARTFDHMRR